MHTLKDLLKGIIKVNDKTGAIKINNIETDSTKVCSGDLFVALKGVKTDGHKYIESAVKNGAAAILCEDKINSGVPVIYVENTRNALSLICANYYSNPADNLAFAGITGTNGKTSVAYFTHYIFSKCGRKSGLMGTVENFNGDKWQVSEYTTPDPVKMQKLLHEMLENGCNHCVMEVSSHALSQERTAGINFTVGAFTNFTRDHIDDYHLTMENYLNEKLKLMKSSDNSVINIDDKNAESFIKSSRGNALTYGINNSADITAFDIINTEKGSEFSFSYKEKTYKTGVNVRGLFSVYNALCALGISIVMGIKPSAAADAMRTAPSVKGRMESVDINEKYSVILDYAHTPDALENVLKTIRNLESKGKLTVLFGCGGDKDREKRPLMGKIASEFSDNIIITTDNPRTEEPAKIIDDILAGIKNTKTPYTAIENRKDAIEHALKNAKEGDVLLFAGKGHEDYQIIGKQKIHFDEREIITLISNKKL